MTSLAPNTFKIGSVKIRRTAVKATAIRSMAVNELPKICSARDFCPLPSCMEANGAAPLLTSWAKEETRVIIGTQTPNAVKATVPVSGIYPTYIRSTTLYSRLTIWEMIEGMANEINSLPIGSAASFFSLSFPECPAASSKSGSLNYGFLLGNCTFCIAVGKAPNHRSGKYRPIDRCF